MAHYVTTLGLQVQVEAGDQEGAERATRKILARLREQAGVTAGYLEGEVTLIHEPTAPMPPDEEDDLDLDDFEDRRRAAIVLKNER